MDQENLLKFLSKNNNLSFQSNKKLNIKYKNYKSLNGKSSKTVYQVGDGSIIKLFDRTPYPQKPTDVICPHFLELKWANGCPFDCSWCYLQGTFRFLVRKKTPFVKDIEKTKGELFNQLREGIIQTHLNERLWGLFVELLRIIDALFDGIDEMEILEKILNDEKAYDMINRLLQNGLEMKNAA